MDIVTVKKLIHAEDNLCQPSDLLPVYQLKTNSDKSKRKKTVTVSIITLSVDSVNPIIQLSTFIKNTEQFVLYS